ACAVASPASTVLRTRPHRSISQLTSSATLKLLRGPPPWLMPLSTLCPALPRPPLRVAPAFAVTIGKKAACACCVSARASRTRASAALIVWLLTSTSLTSASSCGSLNTVHHGPRGSVSRGCAVFHPCASLYAAGVSVSGRA